MKIDTNILEKHFLIFSYFLKEKDGQPFTTFKNSKLIDDKENYKYSVYNEARENLGNKWWKSEDIGTGKIQKAVSSAIKTRVNHNNRMEVNNLVDWRKKDDFSKLPRNRSLEQALFNFYKSKEKDSESFEKLINEGLSYQFIAYLFFIKDYQRFMPISQIRFDSVFENLGVSYFKTSGKASWENYSTYLDLIKQTKDFLKTKDKQTTLLDAHTFLWILGQIREETEKETHKKYLIPTTSNHQRDVSEDKPKIKQSNATELTSEEWADILLDKNLTNEFNLSIFQALYSFDGHQAYASQIALILDTTHPPINLEIGRYAKRIATKFDINFTERSINQYKFWDLFFNGWDEGINFVWQLRPELIKALEITKLTGDEKLAEELPIDLDKEFFEGIKRLVTVNAFERNTKAREVCIKHWKALCAVCDLDFEKTYGEIGKGFIHVHHLTPISQIGKSYQVDPIKDLIPVCPNCHAMLHRTEPPFSIDELKKFCNQAKGQINN